MRMAILLRSGLSMKNLLFKIAILVLTMSLALVSFACGGDEDATSQTTGKYKYRIATGTKVNEETKENETYKYYSITGYEVSSEDALKMAEGDFSTVSKYRDITIPKTGRDLGEDNDYPVEEIDAGAFTNQIILTSVVVGDNIKKIGEGAFAGCMNLEKLSLPFIGESVEALNSARVFGHIFGSSSTDENNVEVTAKTTERKDEIGNSILGDSTITFKVPSSLKEVDLSNSTLTNISECAFYGMSMLKTITIPETVTEIDSHAFFNCSGIISFDLKNVKTIYESAFTGCTSLHTVNFGSVETIKMAAFQGCTSLGSKRFVDETTEEGENKLTIKLPSSLKELGKSAFKGCSSVIFFDIKGTAITVIDNSVFAECFALKKITINDNSIIRAGAFTNCSELKKNIVGTYTAETGAFDSED